MKAFEQRHARTESGLSSVWKLRRRRHVTAKRSPALVAGVVVPSTDPRAEGKQPAMAEQPGVLPEEPAGVLPSASVDVCRSRVVCFRTVPADIHGFQPGTYAMFLGE